MDDFTDFGTDYGQREPLTRRIRNLLKDYPDGLPVPKELIQNADDAQASECCLLLDLRRHSTENLINPKVRGFQGPALVFWNNQTFSPVDFHNLCEFGGETKLEDRKKVGKFGLGFNSVYNLTDLPQFVSGEHFCVLDPHEKYFNGKRGKMFKLGEIISHTGQPVAEKIRGQLEPFNGLFGFYSANAATGMKYKGTIFRLPLRSCDNASVSDICKNPYTEEEALRLIEMANKNANLFLLFVQFVNKFQIAAWDYGRPQFRSLSVFERTFVNGDTSNSQVLFGGTDCFNRSYQICIRDQIRSISAPWDIFVTAPGVKSVDGTRNIGAIAFPSEDLQVDSQTKTKFLFCFLPLPVPPDTGLPFLVNATFAVTSSRRYLEFSTMDDKSTSKNNDGKWNRDLILKGVVPALCNAVLAKSRTHEQKQLFHLFPCLNQVADSLMELLIRSFYEKMTTDGSMKVFLNKARRTYHALVENSACIFSEHIPIDIQDALISCASAMPSNYVWLQVPANILTTIQILKPDLCRQKVKTIEYFLAAVMTQLCQILDFGETFIYSAYKFLLYALENHSQNKTIVNSLSRNPWIFPESCTDTRSSNIVLRKPNELVRPDGAAASLLSFTNDFFPSQIIPFRSDHFQTLCKSSFGMFSDRLPIEAIKAIVNNLNNGSHLFPVYKEKFSQFATHLHHQQFHYRKIKDDLETIVRNLKVLAENPEIELKSHQSVYQKEVKALVSYQFSTADFSELGVHERSFLDEVITLYKTPSMDTLLANLKLAINDQQVSFLEKCQSVVAIFSFIQTEHVNSRNTFFNNAQNYRFIPSKKDSVFCNLNQVCLSQNCPVLDGHLYSVNATVSANFNATALLTYCHVKNTFTTATYENVINNLTKITDEQVIELRSILEYLKKSGSISELKLPGKDGIMYQTSYLCLDDYELQGNSTVFLDQQLKYCHPAIPHGLALHFGVRTKRQMILETNSTPLFKKFRQSESLCNRLSRIMQSYSNDMDIFKELIQNADDAGASEIHFVLDLRKLSKNYIFDRNWERLLEPALLVFNDAHFSTTDIEGIQKLGEGSKRNENSKIGKFGVGFNCVYKLTDYPTFLTQVDGRGSGNLCLLDPCCVMTNEGCMIDVNADLQNNFPDSFSGFFVGNSSMNALEGKTMLRLPLRKNESALCKNVPSIRSLKSNLQQLACRSEQFLLFLQNINTIKVSFLTGTNLERFSVCSKTVTDFEQSLLNFRNDAKTYHYYLHNIAQRYLTFTLYELTVKATINGNNSSRKWLISEQAGSSVAADSNLVSWHCQIDSPPRRHGAVALLVDTTATKEKCMLFCYLPIEETTDAAQNEAIDIPVHVNGQFFLGESRRVIELNRSEKKGLWNAYLLQNIVGPAYGKLVEHFISLMAQKQIPFQMKSYLSLFPSFKVGHNKISANTISYFIAKGLFELLKQSQFVPSMGRNDSLLNFLHASNVYNLISIERSLKWQQNESLMKLISLAMQLSIPLTKIPDLYSQLWRQSAVSLPELEPLHVLNTLKQTIRPPVSIQETPLEDKSTLLCLITWANSCIISHNDKNSLPIYLSAGGVLYNNTSGNKLYSNDMNLLKIFPQMANQLLDYEVESKLLELNITCKMTLTEFMANLLAYFPGYCRNEIVAIADANHGVPPLKDVEKWVCHIWDFLVQEQSKLSEIETKIDQLSILLCRDRNDCPHLLPISKGTTCVFSKLGDILIGTVKINLNQFDCFYELNSALFNQRTKGPRSSLIADLIFNNRNNPVFFINILKEIREYNDFDGFSDSMRSQLKEYFYTSYDNEQLSHDATVLEALRSLPIHLTLDQKYDSLCGPQRLYSIPTDIPLAGLHCGETLADKFVPEENSPRKRDLQRCMGVIARTGAQVYVEFIIPLLFPHADDDVVHTHLEYLAANVDSKWNKVDQDAIIASIQNVTFLENKDGEKKTVQELHDSKKYLYRKFLQSSKLLSSQYDRMSSILSFLRRCGLKHEVTKNDLWHFIDLLASEFIQLRVKLEDEDFTTIKKIVKKFEKIGLSQLDYNKLKVLPLFETENKGINPLTECYDFNFYSVAALVAPVLSYRFGKEVLADRMLPGLRPGQNNRIWSFWKAEKGNNFEPSVELVCQNLTTMCSRRSKKSDEIFTCLKYLSDRKNMMPQSVIKALSKLPSVEVKNCKTFLPARQVSKVAFCCCAEFQSEHKCILTEYLDAPIDHYLQLWTLFEKCGATDTFNLQQVIYTLETFNEEFQGDIQKSPNMPGKYESLEKHFFLFLSKCSTKEIGNLDTSQPIFLRTRGKILKNLRDCILIDDYKLFDFAAEKIENFENFIPKDNILQLKIPKYVWEKLPVQIRPKFFSEMATVTLDPSTKDAENSRSDELNLDAVLNKLRDERFQERCISVLQTQLDEPFDLYKTYSENRLPIIQWDQLRPMANINLTPVKKLLLRSEIRRQDDMFHSGHSFIFERSKIYVIKDPQLNIVFVHIEDRRKNEKVLQHVIEKILRFCKITNASPGQIELISYLLFHAESEEEQNAQLREEGIDTLSVNSEDEQLSAQLKLGETVPFSMHAIIVHDPFRSFRMKDFVAIKVSPIGFEDIFKFGQFFGEESAADHSTDPITMAKMKIKLSARGNLEIMDGSKVYAFKEKPDEPSGEVSDNRSNSNDQMEEDLKKMAQIIWNSGQNCSDADALRKNLSDINTRIVESLMNKYQSPDEQQSLINSLGRMISQEVENARERQREQQPDQSQPTNENNQYSNCQTVVQDYVMQHFQRMRNAIEAYDNFQRAHTSTSSGSYRSNGGHTRTSNTIKSLIRNPYANSGPHPGLAKLWLKQASEDIEVLNVLCDNTATSQIYNAWSYDMSVKVIENSLAAVLMTYDYSVAPQFARRLGEKNNFREVFEWISSHCIEHLRPDLKDCFQKLIDDIMKSYKDREQLHRPDTTWMITSRCALPMDETATMVKLCREMYCAAQKAVAAI